MSYSTLGVGVLVTVIGATAASAEEVQYSKLWGENGELWSPTSRLPDFSHAGFERARSARHETMSAVPTPTRLGSKAIIAVAENSALS